MKVTNLKINDIEIDGTYSIHFYVKNIEVKKVAKSYKKTCAIGLFNNGKEMRCVKLYEGFDIKNLILVVDNERETIKVTIEGKQLNEFFTPFTPSNYPNKGCTYVAPVTYLN